MGLKSEKPEGAGYNNSTQYVFEISYPSFISGKDEKIKLEVGLRQLPLEKPSLVKIKHFYQDPFTREDLIPANEILSLTFREAVAEKLKAAISRRDPAIRDFYDLWYIAEYGFDFADDRFVRIFQQKLHDDNFNTSYYPDFGLTQDVINLLQSQIEGDLIPVIRTGETFDLEKVFDRFNKILKNI